MYTRCPKCSTCFRVTDRHLAIANGKVRCGQCNHIFNAPEHAVDDLPINQLNNESASSPSRQSRASVKTETNKISASVTAKPKTESRNKPVTEKQKTESPVFKADATMIADLSGLEKDEVNEIDLDKPADTQGKSSLEKKAALDETEDDDLFDDSFDLNAAIEELTQATDDKDDILITEKKPPEENPEMNLPKENHSDNVFTTDAYDATNATSVEAVFDEMEGQLSLNISEPKKTDDYNADDEFEFIQLDDEPGTSNDDAQDDYFEIDGLEPGSEAKEKFDEDELFDQIDLSDFNESEPAEEIILEEETNKTGRTGTHVTAEEENYADIDVPFQLRNDLERLQTSRRRRWHPLYSFVLLLILVFASFTQVAYFRAHEIIKFMPAASPLLETFCEKLNCHYSGPRDIKQIQLVNRDVRLHPKEKNALLISAAMVNQAKFAQPYPDIHIKLSDISGNVVAERVFNAKTYMGKLSNPFLLMKTRTPVHINFEVIDPGKDAVNFEFTFQ